jgi:hypothetical protein
MPSVPGLRSNYAKVGGLVYLGRMFDKIRLHAAGKLPTPYHGHLGVGFDARAVAFLRVPYDALKARVLQGGSDDEILAWCFASGGERSEAERLWWNNFIMKRGWRDDSTELMRERIAEYGLTGKPIETWFDLNEFDEGRDPVAERAWEKA